MTDQTLEDAVRQLAIECADEAAAQTRDDEPVEVHDPMQGDRDALEDLLADDLDVVWSQAARAKEAFTDAYRQRLREIRD